jgi:acetyltransferase-like isoleucine patch superfamily enzyme
VIKPHKENPVSGAWNRLLALLARFGPGAENWRIRFHRWRGVKIGKDCWIGSDVIVETSRPYLVTLGDRVAISMGVMIIAHMRESKEVIIGNDVVIGPGAIILPNVTIGDGSVITAGTVVSSAVPPMTVMQGNPAKPIAKVGIVLGRNVELKEFSKHLKPIR